MTSSIPKLHITEAESAEDLLDLYRIQQEDLDQLREIADQVIPHVEQIISEFYDWMQLHPAMMAFFETEETIKHVRKMQNVYWHRFMQAEVDADYLADRRRIGEIHAKIGLPVMFYMGGVSMVYERLTSLSRRLSYQSQRSSECLDLSQCMAGLLHLDAGLICQSFVDKRDQLINEQSQVVMAMSTPVTEIWDGILLLPIVGIVDSRRSEDIMNAVLEAVKTTKAREFILDISGVGVVDTAVANYLISITKATSLMGCRSTISGISPAISKTIIHLGVNIGEVNTTSTMMDALSNAFENRGLALKVRDKKRMR
jgi:rsbT co-antagonist protein RsbR